MVMPVRMPSVMMIIDVYVIISGIVSIYIINRSLTNIIWIHVQHEISLSAIFSTDRF